MKEGWMVMKTRKPSSRSITWPRIFVTGDRLAEQRLRGRRAERDDQVGLDQRELLVEPPAAGLDLAGIRLRVDAALAARLELEMLDRIGDVDLLPVDAGLVEIASKTLPAGPTNGLPARSSWSPGCSPTNIDPGVFGSFAEHGLRRVAPQRAAAASPSRPRAIRQSSLASSSDASLAVAASANACAWTLAWCGAGVVGILAIISLAALSAPAISPGMSEASGRFRQYFFGISVCMAFTLSRAGLKMFSK